MKFLSKIDDSEWLLHSRRILTAAVTVAEKLELEKASVLVHCRYYSNIFFQTSIILQ